MPTISVGSPLVPGRGPWPECGEFNLYDAGAELRLFFRSPTPAEVGAVRSGPCRFALRAEGDVLFLLYQFGAAGEVPWSDAPYSWHLVPEGRRAPPPVAGGGETRALLQVVLTDAATGVVRAIRAVTLSPDFTRALHGAVRAQAAASFCGQAAYDARLAEAYRRWPTTAALLAAATHRTEGGA